MCRLNPKVDFAFKKLFGSEENKDILISFINSILSDDEQVKDIELRNPYNLANYKKDKMSILDINAVDEKGIQEGIKEGEKIKALEITKNLLDVLDNETIALKTGLIIEEIQKLR